MHSFLFSMHGIAGKQKKVERKGWSNFLLATLLLIRKLGSRVIFRVFFLFLFFWCACVSRFRATFFHHPFLREQATNIFGPCLLALDPQNNYILVHVFMSLSSSSCRGNYKIINNDIDWDFGWLGPRQWDTWWSPVLDTVLLETMLLWMVNHITFAIAFAKHTDSVLLAIASSVSVHKHTHHPGNFKH